MLMQLFPQACGYVCELALADGVCLAEWSSAGLMISYMY